MHTNKRMKEYLTKFQYPVLAKEMDQQLTTFRLWEDCVLVEYNVMKSSLPLAFHESYFDDRTECEASINHLHINALFKREKSFEQLVQFALSLMANWECGLQRQFPKRTFHLVLAIHHEDQEISMRFYTVRDHEVPWVNLERLNSYTEEAILVKCVGA